MRNNTLYLVCDEINEGYEWVFNDSDTFCVEKLDGSNLQIRIKDDQIVEAQNRDNPIDLSFKLSNMTNYYMEAVMTAARKGYIKKEDGEYAGEAIGPQFQGNPYGLTQNIWYPFDRSVGSLRYKSFDDYERTFDNWSSWFKDYLKSRYYMKLNNLGFANCDVFAEGVIFYNLKRKSEGKLYMAKLRRDMFKWYYPEEIQQSLVLVEGE